MKRYKALMLDLDGTTIPNDINGMPSKKVTQAIKKANKKVHINVVTGRPFFYIQDIIKELDLKGLAIANGGATIVDTATGNVVRELLIPKDELVEILNMLKGELKSENVPIYFNGQDLGERSVLYHESLSLERIKSFSVFDLHPDKADHLHSLLKQFPAITAHKVVGWKEGTHWLQVSHSEATKQHAVLEVAQILGIKTHEMIGVGDGYNDFPLLMACGLRVAMGNAVDELKAIADYIAPSVDEDGVAKVIEKFIL